MPPPDLLPGAGLRLDDLVLTPTTAVALLVCTAPAAVCPRCETASDRVHSHYRRHRRRPPRPGARRRLTGRRGVEGLAACVALPIMLASFSPEMANGIASSCWVGTPHPGRFSCPIGCLSALFLLLTSRRRRRPGPPPPPDDDVFDLADAGLPAPDVRANTLSGLGLGHGGRLGQAQPGRRLTKDASLRPTSDPAATPAAARHLAAQRPAGRRLRRPGRRLQAHALCLEEEVRRPKGRPG